MLLLRMVFISEIGDREIYLLNGRISDVHVDYLLGMSWRVDPQAEHENEKCQYMVRNVFTGHNFKYG